MGARGGPEGAALARGGGGGVLGKAAPNSPPPTHLTAPKLTLPPRIAPLWSPPPVPCPHPPNPSSSSPFSGVPPPPPFPLCAAPTVPPPRTQPPQSAPHHAHSPRVASIRTHAPLPSPHLPISSQCSPHDPPPPLRCSPRNSPPTASPCCSPPNLPTHAYTQSCVAPAQPPRPRVWWAPGLCSLCLWFRLDGLTDTGGVCVCGRCARRLLLYPCAPVSQVSRGGSCLDAHGGLKFQLLHEG